MSPTSRGELAGASAAGARTTTSCVVEGEVVEVLGGYGLAHVRALDGSTYGLTRETPGVSFADLREGQRVRVEVAHKFNRVLRALLIE
ncbi:MAG: hypothetical protein KIT35_16670 [Piscinibacter sp.]|uniref:hypothetical protein n=1 Tax=Piscinibacter sp. TaxID=1903157 RepID=UPI00258E27B5|nr:hypothetical protein [Piscinibacter sp.]MCW5665468.1 hypothetical protein [Piscinibacter sp.]